jgi:hypothetical protein
LCRWYIIHGLPTHDQRMTGSIHLARVKGTCLHTGQLQVNPESTPTQPRSGRLVLVYVYACSHFLRKADRSTRRPREATIPSSENESQNSTT